MNPTPVGGMDYYECTIGITPTVVSNFYLPNSNMNKDGPYLQIIEQPQTKFRFRYQSEMVGTHGQLKAESSNKNNNVYPTIKLKNWNGGSALIKLTLFTAEDNVNDRKKHVHQLHGKNCKEGVCEVVIDEKNDFTAQFPSLGIIHIAKRDVSNIICERKKDELINNARIANPGLRNETIQHNISPTDLKKIKEAADEEAKGMDLNKVVLRFQAFFYDQIIKSYRSITDFVESGAIFNLKNASTGELKIVRISAASASCAGGAEVWMLVEKVKKSNVKIKFFELDQEGNEIWKSYGDFKDSDVHHQYAIVFKTPAYHDTNIREAVHIKVQLERTTDNDTSEPHDFIFTPETLKRSNAFMEQHHEPDLLSSQKRARKNSMEPVNLKMQNILFRGSGEIKAYETPNQSPPQRVPSPIGPADSPASQGGFYSPVHNYNPSIKISHSDEEQSFGVNQLATQTSESQQFNSPNYFDTQYMINGGTLTNMNQGHVSPPGSQPQGGMYSTNTQLTPGTSHLYHQVPSPSYGQHSPLYVTEAPSPSHSIASNFGQSPEQTIETAMDQIRQFNAVQKQVYTKNQDPMTVPSPSEQADSPSSLGGFYSPPIYKQNQSSTFSNSDEESSYNMSQFGSHTQNGQNQFKFMDMINNSHVSHIENEQPDLLSLLCNDKLFVAHNSNGDIQVDSASSTTRETKSSNKPSAEIPEMDPVDSITQKLSSVSVSDKSVCEENTDPRFKVTMKAVQHLSGYFNCPKENVNNLLETHKFLLSIQNEDGDNAIHNGVFSKNIDFFKSIMKAASNLNCQFLFNVQNHYGETPLHLALKLRQFDMAIKLIKTPGVHFHIPDSDGNSALHLTSALPPSYLKAILLKPVNGLNQTIKKSINAFNYEGETALHMAVRGGILENVSSLIKSGASVHQCERKQGANPLHLAVINGCHDIAEYLIDNTNITVDAGLLNSDTALHIAAQAKDIEMCSILMAARANPNARNNLKKSSNEREDVDSSSDEDEQDFCTPIDYARGDQKLLDVLREEIV